MYMLQQYSRKYNKKKIYWILLYHLSSTQVPCYYFNKVDQTGTLLLPNKTSINERLLVHQSVQIIIGMSTGFT